MIHPSLVKMCSKVIDGPLTELINQIITEGVFPDTAMIAQVSPVYKKKDRTGEANYRLISVIGPFPKVLKWYFQNALQNDIDKCLSNLISAFRKNYSSNHVLIRLIEK